MGLAELCMLCMLRRAAHAVVQEVLKAKLEELKDDPELKEVMEDIEKNGQAAMARWGGRAPVCGQWQGWQRPRLAPGPALSEWRWQE